MPLVELLSIQRVAVNDFDVGAVPFSTQSIIAATMLCAASREAGGIPAPACPVAPKALAPSPPLGHKSEHQFVTFY